MITLTEHDTHVADVHEASVDIALDVQDIPVHSFTCELCFDVDTLEVLDVHCSESLLHQPDCFVDQVVDRAHGKIYISCGFDTYYLCNCTQTPIATVTLTCKKNVASLLHLGEQTQIQVYS